MQYLDTMPSYVDYGTGTKAVNTFVRFDNDSDWYGWGRLGRYMYIYIRPNANKTAWEYKLFKAPANNPYPY